MKKNFLYRLALMSIVICSCSGLISSCSTTKSTVFAEQTVHHELQENLLRESWQKKTMLDPQLWQKYSDDGLWLANPNTTKNLSPNLAFSTMQVQVADFTKIKIHANCQVQIIGGSAHNDVVVFGPNAEVRQLAFIVHDNTLNITPADPKSADATHVVVRVAIQTLQELEHMGSGKVTVRFLNAAPLNISAKGSGNIMLTGKVNVRNLDQQGSGAITILGVYSPDLKIVDSGSGVINLQGRVGVSTIAYTGSGNINIVGVDSNALAIKALGSGQIVLKGKVKLNKITAGASSEIYIDKVNSKDLYIYLDDHATVGLNGVTDNLYVDSRRNSVFAGSSCFSNNSYLQTNFRAHINAIAKKRAFATARGQSSIYLIGKTDMIAPYLDDDGVIIPLPDLAPHADQSPSNATKRDLLLGGETFLS